MAGVTFSNDASPTRRAFRGIETFTLRLRCCRVKSISAVPHHPRVPFSWVLGVITKVRRYGGTRPQARNKRALDGSSGQQPDMAREILKVVCWAVGLTRLTPRSACFRRYSWKAVSCTYSVWLFLLFSIEYSISIKHSNDESQLHYRRNQVRTIEVVDHNASACHSDNAERQPNLVSNKLTNHMLPSEMTSYETLCNMVSFLPGERNVGSWPTVSDDDLGTWWPAVMFLFVVRLMLVATTKPQYCTNKSHLRKDGERHITD